MPFHRCTTKRSFWATTTIGGLKPWTYPPISLLVGSSLQAFPHSKGINRPSRGSEPQSRRVSMCDGQAHTQLVWKASGHCCQFKSGASSASTTRCRQSTCSRYVNEFAGRQQQTGPRVPLGLVMMKGFVSGMGRQATALQVDLTISFGATNGLTERVDAVISGLCWQDRQGTLHPKLQAVIWEIHPDIGTVFVDVYT